MTWFRFYNEFASDAKVQSMSEAMQRRLIMLFCFQSSGELSRLDEDTLGFAMRLNAEELEETKQLFIKKGFIKANWTIKNWDKRQYKSDSSRDRQKRYRDGNDRHQAVTTPSPGRHDAVTVTPPEADTDTDTEAEAEKTPPLPPEGAERISDSVEPFESSPEPSSEFGSCLPMASSFTTPSFPEIARLAEEWWPTREFGRRAEADAAIHGPAVVERAMRDAKASEESQGRRIGNWKYMRPIIERIEEDIRNPPRKNSGPKVAERPVHVAPADSIFRIMHEARVG